MRCSIHLDVEALRHNYREFQKLSAPSTVIPVIKSNAYGHGLAQIYAGLKDLDPPWFGVNYLAEAVELRSLGYKKRILVVGPIKPDDVQRAGELDLDIFLGEEHTLQNWLQLPAAKQARAHLKIDTGMSRQGFTLDQLPALSARLEAHKSRLVGICSHFSNVEDVLAQNYAQQQLATFEKAIDVFKDSGFELLPHIAASSSALLMEKARYAFVRIGISLYGLWPSRTTQLSFLQTYGKLIDLKPVLSWRTEVAILKQVKSGQYIGYGCTYKALRDMTIAVIPVGYNEGYPRLSSNRGHVLIRGEQCPIVGRICMNMMMIDITHIGPQPVGTVVTLIGKDGEEVLEAAQIGDWSETIHYEVLTKLNPDIPKVME